MKLSSKQTTGLWGHKAWLTSPGCPPYGQIPKSRSSLTLGKHHSFLRRGLSAFFQRQRYRLVEQRLHHSQLHQPARQQPQFPVAMALGRRTAGQGDKVGFLHVGQLPVSVRLDSVFQSLSNSFPARCRFRRSTAPSHTSGACATLGAVHPSSVFCNVGPPSPGPPLYTRCFTQPVSRTVSWVLPGLPRKCPRDPSGSRGAREGGSQLGESVGAYCRYSRLHLQPGYRPDRL